MEELAASEKIEAKASGLLNHCPPEGGTRANPEHDREVSGEVWWRSATDI